MTGSRPERATGHTGTETSFSRDEAQVTVPAEEAPANYVPAAAVIRRVRALSGIIGRKELVGGSLRRE